MRPILESMVAGIVISKLQTANKVVGVKQTRKAIAQGRAVQVFLASDADPALTQPLKQLCRQNAVPVDESAQMRALGAACGIARDCAACAVTAQ